MNNLASLEAKVRELRSENAELQKQLEKMEELHLNDMQDIQVASIFNIYQFLQHSGAVRVGMS